MNIFDTKTIIFRLPEEKELVELFQRQNSMDKWIEYKVNDNYISFKRTTYVCMEEPNEETEINPAGM